MGDDEEPLPSAYTIDTGANPECPHSFGHNGNGKAKYMNGDTYDGNYVDGKRQGPGVYTYRKNKATFKGEFEQNIKTGKGRVTYKEGYYEGFFENGKRHGEGTFQYPNKDIYSGMWKDGKRHGKGTYVYANTKYELKGVWKEGQIVQGTWTFTDGTRFVGSFQQNKPCGDGVWETKDGTIVEGAYVQQVVPLDDTPKKPDGTPATETRIFWNTATMVAAED
jgi:hypothetical protein